MKGAIGEEVDGEFNDVGRYACRIHSLYQDVMAYFVVCRNDVEEYCDEFSF